MVLIMSVNPGFGGQKLIPYTVEKVRALKKMIDEKGLKTDIEVDGGVNLENVTEVMDAGANIIVLAVQCSRATFLRMWNVF